VISVSAAEEVAVLDRASLKILGSDDAGYRRRVERAVRRADLNQADRASHPSHTNTR
jgi:hypothetical protein